VDAVNALLAPSTSLFDGQIEVSPDGSQIYLTFGNLLISVSATAVEQVVHGLRTLAQSDMHSVDLGAIPDAVSLSPAGSQLYVAVTASTAISIIDTPSLTLETGVPGIAGATSIAFTPDGKQALIASAQDHRVLVVDTASKAITDSVSLTGSPQAVVSADNAHAYALISTSESGVANLSSTLVPLDLNTMLAGTPVDLGVPAESMTITPQGDRIYFPTGDTATYVPVGSRVPADWFISSASASIPVQAFPSCFPQPAPVDLALVFGQRSGGVFQTNTVAAGLSQVVPVKGPCAYEFSFWGSSDDPDAVAEIFWLDSNSSLLRTDTVVFPVAPSLALRTVFTQASRSLQLQLQRASFISPAGAAQAEVRFTAPAFARVIVGKSHLEGTADVLINSDFRILKNGSPAGWTLVPQAGPGLVLTSSDGTPQLINTTTVDAELIQRVAIVEQKQFAWQFQGRALRIGLPGPLPQVELHFLDFKGADAGPPLELTIAPDAFANRPATGSTPAGTKQVEIHLKVPPGAGVEIDEVSFELQQNAPVPLTFAAQSPGELRVSRSIVTYDAVPVAPPPVPAAGLATPTPPGGKPGEPPCEAFCTCCETVQPIAKPSSQKSASGRPIISGECPTCGSALMRPGGPSVAGAPVLRFPALPSHRPVAGQPPLRARRPSPFPPFADVGIREDRARLLAEVGITTVEQLAAAAPEDITKVMKGLTLKSAAGFIEKAKRLIAASKRPAKPRKGSGADRLSYHKAP
jgi:hypothetical protein